MICSDKGDYNLTSHDLQPIHLHVKGHSGGNLGTWAFCLNLPNTSQHKLESGTLDGFTNNMAELEACIAGFEALKRPSLVSVFSNSIYLRDGLNLLLNGTPYSSNVELWTRLDVAIKGHVVSCTHIKKVDNTGYMRLVDSTALNLLPAQYRRVKW